jgi:1,4-alpha-glucan branching enzyme
MQVWSGEHGYPGDFAYREFHRKDAVSGMQYWRIGGREVDLGDKPPYEPAVAINRTADHAAHFSQLVQEQLVDYFDQTGKVGVISAAFDTELFGHWWFEGVDWLKHVLRNLAASETVKLTTASRIVEEETPERVMILPESSWGSGGSHFTWLNDDTAWMWPLIHAAESRMEALVAENPDPSRERADLLQQIARELLLAESSDWPFLVTTGQANEYATLRFNEHLLRFNQLADLAEGGDSLDAAGKEMLSSLHERDNPFPDIDYRVFASRQGHAGDTPAV